MVAEEQFGKKLSFHALVEKAPDISRTSKKAFSVNSKEIEMMSAFSSLWTGSTVTAKTKAVISFRSRKETFNDPWN